MAPCQSTDNQLSSCGREMRNSDLRRPTAPQTREFAQFSVRPSGDSSSGSSTGLEAGDRSTMAAPGEAGSATVSRFSAGPGGSARGTSLAAAAACGTALFCCSGRSSTGDRSTMAAPGEAGSATVSRSPACPGGLAKCAFPAAATSDCGSACSNCIGVALPLPPDVAATVASSALFDADAEALSLALRSLRCLRRFSCFMFWAASPELRATSGSKFARGSAFCTSGFGWRLFVALAAACGVKLALEFIPQGWAIVYWSKRACTHGEGLSQGKGRPHVW